MISKAVNYIRLLCMTVAKRILTFCSLVVTCWERAGLLAFLYLMFSCVLVTFPFVVLCQVWYLIVWIPDLCLFPYFCLMHTYAKFDQNITCGFRVMRIPLTGSRTTDIPIHCLQCIPAGHTPFSLKPKLILSPHPI